MSPEYEFLRKLTLAERLRVVEELWDDIGNSDEPLPLPAWHREELDRRSADLKADPSQSLSREELWRQVDSGNG